MGYLLKEALKMLCGVNRWSYAAFWKIGCQNPKLLIWEECYYEPVLCTSQDSGMGTSEMAWREWEGCLIAPHHDVQARERIELLINQMMVKNQISIVGERIIGRAAFTGNHEWILSEGYNGDIHPPVVFNEMQNQFSAGIKTVAVIPVSPHGVVQLGSSLSIAENVGFVSDVRSLILQLGYIPGALFSDGYAEKSSLEMPYMDPYESIEAATPNPDLCKQMSSSTRSVGSALGHQGYPEAAELVPSDLDMLLNQHVTNVKYEEPSFEHYSSFGNDLFDIFGDDLKSKILCGGNFPSSVTDGPVVGDFSQSFLGGGDVFAEAEGDHLLDAVVTKAARSASKQCSGEDNVSCKTTATKISTSSALTPTPRVSPAYQIEMETMIYPKLSEKLTVSCSPSNSFYGSQISSWVEQSHSVKDENSISTAYSKKPDGSKPNRKRLKPGENPRPRPKDRQMIQDRVKELRDIVPNGAKCSIDALLERTIKHLLFLQSVTKHADKLKESGESKIMNKDGGVLLKDNFEGGATWAFEVGSQSMVCPIIVEDLNPPRQMLVEMLCEDRGFFLEIADIIRGLGLTILKGVMEARNDKVWARFAVEANRDVTRMEIFMSLVSVLEQTVKGGSRAVENNPMIHR